LEIQRIRAALAGIEWKNVFIHDVTSGQCHAV